MRVASAFLGFGAFALAALLGLTGCGSPPRENVEEVFNFTPLAYYEKSTNPDGYSVDVLWPLINSYRNGTARGSRAFPLWMENEKPGHDDLRLFLLFGKSNDGSCFHHDLFPLWYWSGDGMETSRLKLLLCLAGATHNPGYSNRWFFPFYFDIDSETVDTFTLWPLWGFGRHTDENGVVTRKDHVAWPLFRWERSSDEQTNGTHILSFDILAGLFDRVRRRDDLPPEDPYQPRTSTVAGWVLPLVSLFETTRKVTSGGTRILSLLNGRVAQHFESNSDPLDFGDYGSLIASRWEKSEETGELVEEHSHFFPLYSSTTKAGGASDFWVLTPLYRHVADPALAKSDHDVLLGLWHYGVEGEGAARATSWRLLPLLWFTTRPDSKTHLVLPLYYHLSDATSDYFHFIPFYGKNTEANGKFEKTFVLTPLYIRTRDERIDLERTDLLFPLISWEKSVNGTSSRFLPFWVYDKEAARTHWNALLFVDRKVSEVESATMVWPFYADRTVRGEGRLRSVLPILDIARHASDENLPEGDEVSFLFPLASFQSHDAAYRRWFFPIYWWFDDGAGESTKAVWPLFVTHRSSDHTTNSFLWPFFRFGHDEKGDWSQTHLLSPLIARTFERTETTEETHTRFFPLFWWCSGRNEVGPYSTGWVLWPFWRYEEKSSGEICAHSLFKLAEYERSADGADELFAILHAIYRYRREGKHESRSVPFLYRYESEGDAATLYLFHFIPIGL